MLGIPRPEFDAPTGAADPDPTGEISLEEGASASDARGTPPPRERARVRYDSVNEPFPSLQRRKKALRGLGLLVLLAGAWLVYRFVTVNG